MKEHPGQHIAVLALAAWFGVHPACAAILLALYCAQGDLSAPELRRRAGTTSVRAIHVHMRRLRLAMVPEAILTRDAYYNLTPAGRDETAAALKTLLAEVDDFLRPLTCWSPETSTRPSPSPLSVVA